MKVVDLSLSYIENYLGKGDLAAYEKACPTLFKHYFTYWGDRASFSPMLTKKEVLERRKLMGKLLPHIDEQLAIAGLATDQITIVLFVTQGWTNGHAMRDGGGSIVWLPLEGYKTEKQVNIFAAHEIFHGLHYAQSPRWYFSTKNEKENMLRMLVTEGLATYLTKTTMGCTNEDALWADYIAGAEKAKWLKRCRAKEKALAKYVLSNLSSSTSSGLFYTGDISQPFHHREGYYLGLKLWERLAKKLRYPNQKLLTLLKDEMSVLVRKELAAMAGT